MISKIVHTFIDTYIDIYISRLPSYTQMYGIQILMWVILQLDYNKAMPKLKK